MTLNSTSHTEIHQATDRINALLLSKRNEHGWWTGNLSTSALSTATAVMALHKAVEVTQDDAQRLRWQSLIDGGLKWLAEHQNGDGGWGDTVLSISNISTTMLAHAVFRVTSVRTTPADDVISSSAAYISKIGGVKAVIEKARNAGDDGRRRRVPDGARIKGFQRIE